MIEVEVSAFIQHCIKEGTEGERKGTLHRWFTRASTSLPCPCP